MSLPDDTLLAEIERTAMELANLAGAEIVTAVGGLMSVRYKTGVSEDALRDPVSEVDHRIEVLIRARLADKFPNHDIIGEELDQRGSDDEFIWAIDPIDGTTNFVNGFPLFAATIGVLHRGRPVAGAVWCGTSHLVRAGVYHARAGGGLHFDGQPVVRAANPDVRRRLAGVPRAVALEGPWDARKTGSAAIECALAAAGPLHVVRFDNVNLWDVAGGVALILAAGGRVCVREDDQWVDLTAFTTKPDAPDLRHWQRAMIAGNPEAVATMCATAV
jgi:myo-inositol-1(or 4)-monophosphatase